MESLDRLKWSLGVLLLIVCLGVVGYVAIEGWSPFDALYMTITTLTTVGYSEMGGLTPIGRAFTLFLIIIGVGGMLYTLTGVVQYVAEGRLGGEVWRRRMRRQIEKLSNHYIICGFGRVGRQAACEFVREGIPFVVIDVNQLTLNKCAEENVLHVPGDAADDDVLKTAGIMRARGLLAAVADDADNVYVTLSARQIRPDLFIVARANAETAGAKLLRAGANRIISPYLMGGQRMAMLALRPIVVDFIDTVMHSESLELALESIEIDADSPFLGKTIEETRRHNPSAPPVLAIQKREGQMVALPESPVRIEVGDHVVVVGTQAQLQKMDNTSVFNQFVGAINFE